MVLNRLVYLITQFSIQNIFIFFNIVIMILGHFNSLQMLCLQQQMWHHADSDSSTITMNSDTAADFPVCWVGTVSYRPVTRSSECSVCRGMCECGEDKGFFQFCCSMGSGRHIPGQFHDPNEQIRLNTPSQRGNCTELINKDNRDFWLSHKSEICGLFTQRNQRRSTRTMASSPFCDPACTHTHSLLSCCFALDQLFFCCLFGKLPKFKKKKKSTRGCSSIRVDGLNLAQPNVYLEFVFHNFY